MGLGSNSVRDRTCNRRIDISHRGRPAIAAPSACQSEKCALVAADVRAQLRALHFSLVADVLATCLETDWRQGQERLGSHPLDIRLVPSCKCRVAARSTWSLQRLGNTHDIAAVACAGDRYRTGVMDRIEVGVPYGFLGRCGSIKCGESGRGCNQRGRSVVLCAVRRVQP